MLLKGVMAAPLASARGSRPSQAGNHQKEKKTHPVPFPTMHSSLRTWPTELSTFACGLADAQ